MPLLEDWSITMRGRTSALRVTLSLDESVELLHIVRSTMAPAGVARRARVILLVSDGAPLSHAGRATGMMEKHVRKWVRRFLELRLDGLLDMPRPGRKPVFPPCSRSSRREIGVRTS